jgi:tripartite-type tricarboxylate transporter receptor subunit TctC
MKARLLTIAFALLMAAVTPAAAQKSVADFYKGKQLRLVVGSAVGGGYDLYARALARHIVNYIPGHPTIIVQNLPPAGSMVMVNQLCNQGPKDGTAIGAPLNGIPTAPMLQAGTHFDPTKINWLGSLNSETYVGYVWHTVPVSSITDLAKTEVLVGSTTVGTTMSDFPLLLNDLFGYKFRIVRGYKGTSQIDIAIERGELQGNAGIGLASIKTRRQKWLVEKKIKLIAQYGDKPDPEIAGVPVVMDLAKSDAERQAMRLLFSRTRYARPYFLPPGVPKDRVEALRRAFDATMKDKGFVAEAKKLKLDLLPMTGEQMQALVADLAGTPPAVVARVRKALLAPTTKK